MKRKEINVFGTSFLDLLSGALAAVIILFVIVPKGVSINPDLIKEVKEIEAIIMSMTPAERQHPEIINGSRRKRIAAGSGTSVTIVNRLLKQFEETRKVMKMLSGGGGRRLAGMMNAMRGRK